MRIGPETEPVAQPVLSGLPGLGQVAPQHSRIGVVGRHEHLVAVPHDLVARWLEAFMRVERGNIVDLLGHNREALFGFRGGRLGSRYQSRNESAEQGFAAASRVVHELKEPEIKRQLVL